MTTYELMYFNAKGRAEIIRLMFALKEVKYEDTRIGDDWEKRKGEMPFRQMPVLVVDGKHKIAQSGAIVRFVARELGLGGATSIEQAKVDMFAETFGEIVSKIPFFKENPEALMKKAIEEHIGSLLAATEKLYKTEGGEYLAGNSLTYADILLAHVVEVIETFTAEQANYVKSNFPELHKLREKVTACPTVATWIKNRPKTNM